MTSIQSFHLSSSFRLILELEIEQEEQKAKEQAKKKKADMDRVVGAHERAFQVHNTLLQLAPSPCSRRKSLWKITGCTFREF